MRAIDELEGLIVSKVGAIKSLIAMAKLEVKLAGLSLYPLLINVCMILVILMTTWLAAMFMLGYGALWFYDSLLVALGCIFIFNLLLLGLLFKYLMFNLKQMSFEKTRQYLRSRPK